MVNMGTEANKLHLILEGFEGPLDLLLELARAQKVNLAEISILQLAEQYLSFVNEARFLRLELAADWLVMAAWLAWLKSRLLLPNYDEDDEAVENAAEQLQERLVELEHMRQAALWLEARPRLGREIFERCDAEDHVEINSKMLKTDLSSLVSTYLAMRRKGVKKRSYRPRIYHYWTVQEARSVMMRLLRVKHVEGWQSLKMMIPERQGSLVEQRAALAGALLAGLEMAKTGSLELKQDEVFGDIEWRGISV